MHELILEYLEHYLYNRLDFLSLPYVDINPIGNPINYHTHNNYDPYFPPFFTLGNYANQNKKKVVLLSLEPQKKVRLIDQNNLDINSDFFLQSYFLRNINAGDILNGISYTTADINIDNYLNYQLDYFNTFPNIFINQGIPLYADAYNHTYWSYIAHIAKGYLNLPGFFNNLPIRENGWQSLSNGLIDLPIFPMSAPNHPNVEFNHSIGELLRRRLQLISPTSVICLARTHENDILQYLGIQNPPNQIINLNNREVRVYSVNQLGLTFNLITGVALAARGNWGGNNGKYNYAYQIGQIARG